MDKLFRWVLLILLSFMHTVRGQWVLTLPEEAQDSVYWIGDMEEGSLNDWTLDQWQYAGGGIFNTGEEDVEAVVDSQFAHSGRFSARATIANAWQAESGPRAVRLMRWTHTAWDNDGDYFPKKSYYSAFYYFPHTYNPNKYEPWDPGDGGWWNIFQFKSHDAEDVSQPIWTLNVDHNDETEEMSLYLYSKYNPPHSYGQNGTRLSIPVNQWVHLEAYYEASSANTPDGQISIWQDGKLILDVPDVITVLEGEEVIWGIGNYTDHIAGGPKPGTATLYFDDCIVSTLPIHPYLEMSPTSLENDILDDTFLYPNPASDILLINLSLDQTFRVVDVHGKEYVCPVMGKGIDVSGLSGGLYFWIGEQGAFSFLRQ